MPIGLAMEQDRPAKSSTTNDRFAELIADVNDSLESRITVCFDPRATEFLVRVRDEISRSEAKVSISRDVGLADARRRILSAATDLILLTHGSRKRSH